MIFKKPLALTQTVNTNIREFSPMPTFNIFTKLAVMLALFFTLTSVQADIKRTHTGKPDLSGTYDTGTLTPLNRPKESGEKQYMTAEEAVKIQKQMAYKYDLFHRKNRADRKAPVKGRDGNNNTGAGRVGGDNRLWVHPAS